MVATQAHDANTLWVGIGASAGGLEALRALVGQLDVGLNAAFIVAQHMSPHHKSLLAEIIARETELPVKDVVDDFVPSSGTIYITPPNTNVVANNGRIHLQALTKSKAAPKPSVDLFLTTLAADKAERAIAIILSGTGSDGAMGIKAIHAGGGLCIVQDEHTAKYTGMPLAALDTGIVDLILSPEEIGKAFHRFLEVPRNLASLIREPLTNSALEGLTRLILKQTRVDFSHYKTATVQRRVERRMAAVEAVSVDDYLAIARDSPAEVDMLFKDLMITVTSFFRDPDEFDALQKHIAKLVVECEDRDIRIWVAGVATGEEVYSIAMLFADSLGGLQQFREARIQFFATDIDAEAIAIARRGFYAEPSLGALNNDRTKAYFDPSPGGYTVRKAIRERIVFSVHDVACDPPFQKIDLISCRNLLIYFQAALQSRVFDRFHFALKDNALLFLGKSEAVSTSANLFHPALPDKHIFRQSSLRRRRIDSQPFQARYLPNKDKPDSETIGIDQFRSVTAQLESLIRAVGPNAILVSSDTQLLKVYGNIDNYLGISSNSLIDTSVSSLLREPWSQDIRVAVPAVLRKGTVYEGLARKDSDNSSKYTRIIIYPIDDLDTANKCALVVFKNWTEERSQKVPEGADESGFGVTIEELTRELDVARSNLQITVEELETANEELQALNEEFQSSNEELQSTNEELETSGEELQSTNEELSTVNEEMNVNAQQLRAVNSRQRNILDNVQAPMIVVDPELYIVDLSLSARDWFKLPADVEAPHLSRCMLPEGFPSLDALVNESIEQFKTLVREVSYKKIHATLSVAPYFDTDAKLSGVIVQISDNSSALKRIKDELELIFAHTPAAIALCESDGRVINANIKAQQWLGFNLEKPPGDICKLLPESLDLKLTRDEGEQEGDQRNVHQPAISIHCADDIQRRLSIKSIPFSAGSDTLAMALIVLEDETELNEQLEQARAMNHHLLLAERLSKIGYWSVDMGEAHRVMWSSQVYTIHGVDPERYVPDFESGLSFYHEDDVGAIREHLEKAVLERTGFEFKARLVRADKEVRIVRSLGRVELDEMGEVQSIFGVFQDITDMELREQNLKEAHKELERTNEELNQFSSVVSQDMKEAHKELERSNEELSRFSYVCSHDMKEPVRLIASMVSLLQEPETREDEDEMSELLNRLGKNTQRLNAIIDSLLAYSRVEARIEFVPVDLNEIAEEIRENLSLMVMEQGAELRISRLPTITGAPVHFMQLLQNLIGNSLRYADGKAPVVVLRSVETESGHDLIVEDNGPGVPADRQTHIFDIFTRLELNSKIEGSGLGLAICKRIVGQYGGTITCTDSDLGGARFTISLPGDPK